MIGNPLKWDMHDYLCCPCQVCFHSGHFELPTRSIGSKSSGRDRLEPSYLRKMFGKTVRKTWIGPCWLREGEKNNLSVIVSICNTAVSQFIDSRGQYFSYSGQFHLSLAKTENNQQAEVTLISSRSPSTGLLSQANACVEIKYDGRRRGAVMLWHAATTH